MTVIAQAQGIHPLFAGTDTPIGVDEAGTRWAISYQGGGQKRAVLVATFASGASLEFKIPATGITKTGSVAAFTILDFGDAQWVTYAEHVKFEVRFPAGPPKVQTISTNIARLGCDLVSDGEGGLTVLSGGVKVGALPRPWLDYTPDGSEDRTRVWLSWTVAEPQMSLTLPTLTASEWQTAVLDPTVVTSSTAGTATAYSNQRKVDRTSNGVLWAVSDSGSAQEFRYSTDEGATWTLDSSFGVSGNASIFIDADDNMHHVAQRTGASQLDYRHGVPNAARTAYTWTYLLISSGGSTDFPDVVAHREGTGWKAHIVYSYQSSTINRATYDRVGIAADGTLTKETSGLTIGGSYSNSIDTYPSIDFNHTGDGKTVAGGTPHLYVAWSAGATGSGKGIRFKKATYSGGSWTWGTEREIDSASFANAGRISTAFDGTQVVIAYADSASTSAIKIRERDAADTTTAARTPTALSDGVVTGLTVAYDNDKNIHLGAVGATSADPKALKYDRAAGTWGAWEALAATTAQADTLTARRFADTSVDLLYTSGTGSPYSVTYAAVPLVTDQHESGGAAATISVGPSGAGIAGEQASGGAGASVTTATSGAGSPSEGVSRGAAATTTVTTAGAGQAVETVATGAAATVNLSATGAGTGTEAATSSAATSVTVTTAGGGEAATESSRGASTSVTIIATGAGVAREHVTGGSGATVVIVATGGVAEPQAESGGASATVQITAFTGSAATERASAGAASIVTVHTTGRGAGGDPVARDLTITAKLDPARMRATLDRDRMYATLNPDRLAARMEAQ
jgi:hypothetical protein